MPKKDQWETRILRQGDLELVLTPEIGGRLMDIRYRDTSLLFQNPDLEGLQADPAKLDRLPTRTPHFPFPLWGGEKTWIAPDTTKLPCAWNTATPG